MPVYVDDMYLYPMGRFGRMKMSHMMASDEAELHAMAVKIGVARRWYQGDHYDVAMSARAKAIKFGAIPITLKEMANHALFQREHGRWPSEDELRLWCEVRTARIRALVTQEVSNS